MKLTLKNVADIKNAAINLAGLSIIIGKNGSGKSTIGKTVYATIKAIKDKKEIVKSLRYNISKNLCSRAYFTLQNDIETNSTNISIKNADIKHLIENFEVDTFFTPLTDLLNTDNLDDAKILLSEKQLSVENFSDSIEPATKAMVKGFFEDVKTTFSEKTMESEINDSLTDMYRKIFKWQINNVKTHETSEVDFEGLLNFSVSNNADTVPFSRRLKINYADENVETRFFQDVTLIETPLILQFGHLISMLKSQQSIEAIPCYWLDLIKKIAKSEELNTITENDGLRKIFSDFSVLLGGSLKYNEKRRDFEFIKNEFTDGESLFVNNMSSGEKMLGIFQSFVRCNLLGPHHLLILDEPENHLHPEWQMNMAKILVNLSEYGCPILINSHNPDFIQALRLYSKQNKIVSKKIKFYLADHKRGAIEDKTENVAEVLDTLSKPVNDFYKDIFDKQKAS